MLRRVPIRLLLLAVAASVLIGITFRVSLPRYSPYASGLSGLNVGIAGAYASDCPDEMCYESGTGERQCVAVVGLICDLQATVCNRTIECP
jgi:hypothetical protein